MFAILALPTVREASRDGIDLWRPGRDREPAGSVCWCGPGNTDFGVSGPGTPALGRTSPAATASIKVGLVWEDLGMACPDGILSTTGLFRPRVFRLRLPRPPAKYRRLGWSSVERLGTLTSMPSANGPVRIGATAVGLGLAGLGTSGRDAASFKATGRDLYASSPKTAMQMSSLWSGGVSNVSLSFTRPSRTSISERSSIVVGFRYRLGYRCADGLLDGAGASSPSGRGIPEMMRRKRVHRGKLKREKIEKEAGGDVEDYLKGRNEVHQNDCGQVYISSYTSPMAGY